MESDYETQDLIGNQSCDISSTHLEAAGLPDELCGTELLADGSHGCILTCRSS